MDLIANIAAWILTFVIGLLGNILAHDICASADRNCTKIIHKASRRLASFDCDPVEQEWLADLHERETVREKYRHAFGCFLSAGTMRRQAHAVTVLLNFQIDGVGTIPLSLNTSSKLRHITFAAGRSRFPWIRNTNARLLILYFLLKFIKSVKALGPGKLDRLAKELKQYKTWGYSARLKRKGLDVDLDAIFRAMILNPKEIPGMLHKFNDILSARSKASPQSTPSVDVNFDKGGK
jgi:hypothetical protein